MAVTRTYARLYTLNLNSTALRHRATISPCKLRCT
jgi:hypothetical protein